jgi:hypothetical protein
MADFWRLFIVLGGMRFGTFCKLILVRTAHETFGLMYILCANLTFAL